MGRRKTVMGKKGLVEETYDQLRGRILRHDLRPGEHITIDSVARELDISQTPVREALVKLEADGLMQSTPHRGYAVTPLLDEDGYEQLFSFRQLIEPWAAAEAAGQAQHSDTLSDELDEVRRLVENADGATPGDARLDDLYQSLSDHDVRFHSAVAHLAGNRYLVDAYDGAHFHLHLFRLYLSARTETENAEVSVSDFDEHYSIELANATLREHEAIASSIAQHDREAAATLMHEHIAASLRRSRLELQILLRPRATDAPASALD